MTHWFAQLFTYPWGLVLLVLPAVMLAAWVWLEHRRRKALEELAGVRGLVADQPARRRVRLAMRLAALVLLAVGIAGPVWGRDPEAPASQGRDIVVLLDVSRSMLAEEPDRLTRAKFALFDLADAVQRKGGYRVGLVVFAGKAKLLCPLTEDIEHFRYAVRSAHPDRLGPGGRLAATVDDEPVAYGTWLRRGIEKAVAAHEPQFRGYQAILLVSDGDDLPGDWLLGADVARQAGIPVYALGVGDPDKTYPIPTNNRAEPFLMIEDETTGVRRRVESARRDRVLREITDHAGGIYYPEEASSSPLVSWFEQRIAPLPVRELVEDQRLLKVQRFAWFFAAALVLLVLETLLPESPRRS